MLAGILAQEGTVAYCHALLRSFCVLILEASQSRRRACAFLRKATSELSATWLHLLGKQMKPNHSYPRYKL